MELYRSVLGRQVGHGESTDHHSSSEGSPLLLRVFSSVIHSRRSYSLQYNWTSAYILAPPAGAGAGGPEIRLQRSGLHSQVSGWT